MPDASAPDSTVNDCTGIRAGFVAAAGLASSLVEVSTGASVP